MTTRAGRHWTECQAALGALRGIGAGDEFEQSRLVKELDTYAKRLRREYPKPSTAQTVARKLIEDVLGFIGRERLVSAHRAYNQGDWLEKVLTSAAIHLSQSAAGTDDWTATLDAYEGLYATPLMTIHKSKGSNIIRSSSLAWTMVLGWSFAADKIEGTAGFFVAFTRAKQRVAFTYCARRGARTQIGRAI